MNRSLARRPRFGAVSAASAGLLSAAVVLAAVLTLALTATGLMPLVGEPAISLAAWRAVAPDLLSATRESLVIATASTLLAAVVGMSVAVVVAASAPGTRLLAAVAAAPIPIAHIVGAASFALLLSDAGDRKSVV